MAELRWLQHLPADATERIWAEAFLVSACEDERVDAVVAIGSTGRGAAHAGSDLDFVVIFHGSRPEFGRPPIQVDLRTFDRQDVEQRIEARHDLLLWAVRYGRVICERDRYWTALVTRREGNLPLPSADSARARASTSWARAREVLSLGDRDAALELVQAALTQEARARLIAAGQFPASRPELAGQLKTVGEDDLAAQLDEAIRGVWARWSDL